MYKRKEDILKDYNELELTESGDFRIKEEYTSKYKIIDFHCHLFKGLKELYPKVLKKVKKDLKSSFFDASCFPLSLNLFNLNEVCYTKYPKTIMSVSGIKARVKLITGAFVLNKATPERLIQDMALNNIRNSVILQISPPNKNSSIEMEELVQTYPEFITFGSIHPKDDHIDEKMKQYLSKNIKGWKINPHVGGFAIDSKESKELIVKLAKTNLPIVSCSGSYPESILKIGILSKKQKLDQSYQRLERFYEVLKLVPNTKFILSHGGLYECDKLIDLMKEFPNTYTDISTQPAHNIKKLIDQVGSKRLLFGTDYPFFNQSFSLLSVLRATDNEEDRINIFSKNACGLLNIKI